jgi:hypothetical protein
MFGLFRWFRAWKSSKTEIEINIGDYIVNKETHANLGSKYFYNGPLQVIRIDKGPAYAGGKFIIVKWGYGEQGFYINAVKKV